MFDSLKLSLATFFLFFGFVPGRQTDTFGLAALAANDDTRSQMKTENSVIQRRRCCCCCWRRVAASRLAHFHRMQQ